MKRYLRDLEETYAFNLESVTRRDLQEEIMQSLYVGGLQEA
jgi:hypothetical protein